MKNEMKKKVSLALSGIFLMGLLSGYGGSTVYATSRLDTTNPEVTSSATTVIAAPKEANSLVLKSNLKSAPIYDSKTNKKIGTIYKGFSINISSQKSGKAYFTLPLLDPKNPEKSSPKKVYVSVKYLTKAYVEPVPVIAMISLDRITIKKNAPIYNSEDQRIAVFSTPVGKMNFIQKSDCLWQNRNVAPRKFKNIA